MTKLEMNIEKAKLQEKVDSLQVLVNAAIKYNAQNKSMLINDLIRAKTKLEEA